MYFADFVLELQAAEEEKRRRIRDARRRAEKAQREAYREALRSMAAGGSLLPSSRWRNVEEKISADPSFAPVQAHERDAPREIFEDFIEEWNEVYRRDRSFLGRLVHPPSKPSIVVTKDMKYEVFSKALLDEAAHSPDMYSDTRRILNREDPISSARLYFDELVAMAKERPMAGKRRSTADESSEDEGEIREDGEVGDENNKTTSPKDSSND